MKTRVEVYKDGQGDWRWRATRKGRTVADSGEGYERRGKAVAESRKLIVNAAVFTQEIDGTFKLLP